MTKAVKQVGILGVGSYLPSKILTNHDLEKWLIPAMNGLCSAQASEPAILRLPNRLQATWPLSPQGVHWKMPVLPLPTLTLLLLQLLRLITAYILQPPALCRTDCGNSRSCV